MAPAQSSAAQAGPSARALELMDKLNDQKSPVRRQLCIALHRLNMAMVTEHQRPLTQIWLPGFTADGAMALTCDCAPYAIGGDSDLCSLFRCVSCRYTFRPTSTHKQGSIGRVFVTHQPEVCSNLGEAPTHIFHRAREAKECLLRSMCTMPLWVPEITKNAPMAVIEILLPEQHPDFEHLHELTSMALQSVTETFVTIHAPTAAVLPSQPSRGAAASSGPDEANPAQRGRTLARSMREGNSWEGSGASPGMPPDHAWHAGESPPHDHAGRSGRGLPLQDVQGATKPASRSLPVQLSGNSSATPTSVHTPETQTTTGATTAPLSEELVVGFRRSSSPPHRATAGSGLGPGAVSGLASIAGVDRVTSAMQRMQPIKAEPPPPQQVPTLTQTSARHAQELQEAAQQRVLAFVHAQAQARANNAAAGLDMLSLTTPTSGELTIDGHLTTPAGVPAQRTSGHCTHSGFSNSGDVVNASGELATLADGGLKNTSGQLGIPSRGLEALHLDGVHKAGAAAPGGAAGRPGDALRMHDIDNDLFGNGWGLGDALGDGEAPECQGHVHSRSAALHRGLSSVMQMPNTIHRPRLQPFASSPAGQQDRRLSPSPQARRLRHVMEEETCTLSEGNEQGAHVNARDSASESVLLTALQSESNKYVIQKVFSEADLDVDMTDGVRARKKRISPGPGQRSSGGLPDMPGPSTALPFLPDLNEQPSMPQSADAVLGTGAHSGSALTSPPGQGGNGGIATAAAQRGSPQSHSPQYDAQLRQFVHPGVRGGRETFVRVGHSAAPTPLQDSSYQPASSSPFTAVAGQPRPNAGNFWKVPAQAQGHSQGDGEGGKGGPTGTGAPGYQSSNLMGAHVMYQSYANDVKALRSKVNRVDGGIGRKVTLDVLKRQFGKGLKEAADNLGMCPTTLKRACRRLGVKRWPRTAEAANQALLDAEAMQREHSAVGRSDDDKEAAT